MNYWKHSLLSEKKFGGLAIDYLEIHKFLDSSKLFMFHIKHRLLLHNTFGIELCTELFGDFLVNSDGKTILVRDIAAEHCKEDLGGAVPTLNDWFKTYDTQILEGVFTQKIDDEKLEAFVMRPLLRSGLRASLIITWSNFGVYLVAKFLGSKSALSFSEYLGEIKDIKTHLKYIKLSEKWQYTPDKNELNSLKTSDNEESRN
jgi:hypothetical protein